MNAVQQLAWHFARREQGSPTISTLIGPVNLAVLAGRTWASSTTRDTVICQQHDLACVVRQWLEVVLQTVDLPQLARHWLTTRGLSEAMLADCRTEYDLRQLWHVAGLSSTDATAELAWKIVVSQLNKQLLTVDVFTHDVQGVFAVVSFRMSYTWPVMLLLLQEAPPPAFLEELASRVSRLPLVCQLNTVPKPTGQLSRLQALLQEGLIELEVVSEKQLLSQLRQAGIAPPVPDGTITQLVKDGLSPELAINFIEAAKIVRDQQATEHQFRSVHEKFLFEMLEAKPETAGHFQPNVKLGFKHGHTAAEADLCAEKLKLVVEVDGKYYHLSEKSYRTDRRKDWLYQQQGYLVLRFLAEDVVDLLEEILARIVDAVALQQHRFKLSGGSGS